MTRLLLILILLFGFTYSLSAVSIDCEKSKDINIHKIEFGTCQTKAVTGTATDSYPAEGSPTVEITNIGLYKNKTVWIGNKDGSDSLTYKVAFVPTEATPIESWEVKGEVDIAVAAGANSIVPLTDIIGARIRVYVKNTTGGQNADYEIRFAGKK